MISTTTVVYEVCFWRHQTWGKELQNELVIISRYILLFDFLFSLDVFFKLNSIANPCKIQALCKTVAMVVNLSLQLISKLLCISSVLSIKINGFISYPLLRRYENGQARQQRKLIINQFPYLLKSIVKARQNKIWGG